MDAPRAAFAVARANGRIYVLGGSLNYEPLASVRSLGDECICEYMREYNICIYG